MWDPKPGPGQTSCAEIQLQEAAPSMGPVVGKFMHHPAGVVSVSPWDVAGLWLVNPLQREHQNAPRSAHFCCWLHLQGGILACAFRGESSPTVTLLPGPALATAGGCFVPSPPLFPTALCWGPLPMHPHPWLKPEDSQGFSPPFKNWRP